MGSDEGETSGAKRKSEYLATTEEQKERKRKKTLSLTRRPACSWVHFSREFIKDYSATHPESSGLKAATRAASDAWKCMSVEEKAKYTQRAREVWDDYLSTAPARSPKPRKQTKLVTRCSPGRLFTVIQNLTPEQKDLVRSIGFGSLLSLRCKTLRRSLCLWLLERFNTKHRSLEICGESILLASRDVEHIMGLAASGKDVVNSGPDDLISDLRQSYSAANHGISLKLLEERLASPATTEDFKRSFVLYALGTVLSPTARLDVSPSFLHFLTNMDVVQQFNWGKFLLDRLVCEVSKFHQGKQRAVGGCLLFLQLFYYESVSEDGAGVSTPAKVPCLYSWSEEEITEREKRERELGGYGLGKVIRAERCMTLQSYRHTSELNDLSASGMSVEAENLSQCEGEDNQTMNFFKDIVCGDMEFVAESVHTACQNKEDACTTKANDISQKKPCFDGVCSCPHRDCHFTGSSYQLSLHFSTKHWDLGRRFRYDHPISLSMGMMEQSLILQSEEDGALFLVNKGVEAIGRTLIVTRVGTHSQVEFLYEVVVASERGCSSLRLKSATKSFPGRVEGLPPADFLLIPSSFLGPSQGIKLEVCIWSSAAGTTGDCSQRVSLPL